MLVDRSSLRTELGVCVAGFSRLRYFIWPSYSAILFTRLCSFSSLLPRAE